MIDVDAIYRVARRRVWDPVVAEDVAQQACLYAIVNRRAYPWQHVVDAIRTVRGRAGQVRYDQPDVSLEHPEWVPSHYPTPGELRERWQDEESEDQAREWLRLPADERSRRISLADQGLGSSPSML